MGLARSAGVVGALTLVSRVLGLAREVVLAALFGASWQTDALFVAWRIPAMMRRFFAEGVLTSAFVPTFTGVLAQEGEGRARRFSNAVFTLVGGALPVIVGLMVVGAPALIWLFAHGFTAEPEKFDLAVRLTRITFPFLVFVSLAAVAMGVLNSLRHFVAPALAPAIHNVGIIAGALLLAGVFDEPIVGAAVGYMAGGALMLVVQLPALRRRGYAPAVERGVFEPPMGRLMALIGPSLLGVGVYQINLMVAQLLATFLPHGAVSYLWYADRLLELPLGIFAVAVATVSLTALSEHAAAGRREELVRTVNESLRLVLFVTLPATAGILALAVPICAALFQRGHFAAADARATALVVMCQVAGLAAIGGARVTAPAFYALKDTRTPVKAALLSFTVYLATALALMGPLAERGLALATSVSGVVNFLALVVALRRRVGPLGGRRLARSVARSGTAAVVMGLTCYGGVQVAARATGIDPAGGLTLGSGVLLAAAVTGGIGLYALLAWRLGAEEMTAVVARVKRRLGRA
jgi:putative peptidoglycan lipid II flippase